MSVHGGARGGRAGALADRGKNEAGRGRSLRARGRRRHGLKGGETDMQTVLWKYVVGPTGRTDLRMTRELSLPYSPSGGGDSAGIMLVLPGTEHSYLVEYAHTVLWDERHKVLALIAKPDRMAAELWYREQIIGGNYPDMAVSDIPSIEDRVRWLSERGWIVDETYDQAEQSEQIQVGILGGEVIVDRGKW